MTECLTQPYASLDVSHLTDAQCSNPCFTPCFTVLQQSDKFSITDLSAIEEATLVVASNGLTEHKVLPLHECSCLSIALEELRIEALGV